MDIGDTLAPKSDQLDAIELLGHPRTFTIERVDVKGGEGVDQPVSIHLVEFPRVWRPGLSMRRVMAACWGKRSAEWVGHRVTLYCDEKVRFGSEAVGGTRISHLSHIDKARSIPLLVTRGKSAMFTVQPLEDEPAPASKQSPELAKLAALFEQAGIARPKRLALVAEVVGRTVNAPSELTDDEVAAVIAELQLRAEVPE